MTQQCLVLGNCAGPPGELPGRAFWTLYNAFPGHRKLAGLFAAEFRHRARAVVVRIQ